MTRAEIALPPARAWSTEVTHVTMDANAPADPGFRDPPARRREIQLAIGAGLVVTGIVATLAELPGAILCPDASHVLHLALGWVATVAGFVLVVVASTSR